MGAALTMPELVDRLGQAERAQTASYCRMLEVEDEVHALPRDLPCEVMVALMMPLQDEWIASFEMWANAKELVFQLSAQLDRFVR